MRAHFVHLEHDFSKPPERIFAYLAEPEHLAGLFGTSVICVRDGDEGGRNGLGSCRRLKLGPLPPFEETVTEFVAGERIVYRITRGGALRDHLATMTFLPEGDGTRFYYDIRLASPIPGLAPAVRVLLTRSILRSLPAVERDA
jgi:uncharacterized protein YndB with AHSA1/START domain